MKPDEVVIFTVMIRDVEGGEVQLQLDEICDKAPEITISITVRNGSPAGMNWIDCRYFLSKSAHEKTFYDDSSIVIPVRIFLHPLNFKFIQISSKPNLLGIDIDANVNIWFIFLDSKWHLFKTDSCIEKFIRILEKSQLWFSKLVFLTLSFH